MPNHVVGFEVRGPEPEILNRFYRDVFGWDVFKWSPDYSGLDTAVHVHDEATGATTYTGDDAYMNEGVELTEDGGHQGWRFKGEAGSREFSPGIPGGVRRGPPSVSFYIQAKDLEATLANVEQHGGETLRQPEEVAPSVVIAAFLDPAGNEIGLIRG